MRTRKGDVIARDGPGIRAFSCLDWTVLVRWSIQSVGVCVVEGDANWTVLWDGRMVVGFAASAERDDRGVVGGLWNA